MLWQLLTMIDSATRDSKNYLETTIISYLAARPSKDLTDLCGTTKLLRRCVKCGTAAQLNSITIWMRSIAT
jgi:hypothetical protein